MHFAMKHVPRLAYNGHCAYAVAIFETQTLNIWKKNFMKLGVRNTV